MYDAGQNRVPLAIVGMACRLPGANNLDDFWQLVVSGGDATGELPEEVLDRELYFDPRRGIRGKSYSAMGGIVDRLPFDNQKCRLDPNKLENFDPAQLTACEVAYDALRDAGLDPHAIPAMRSGVFFGHTGGSTRAGDIVYSVYIEETARYLHQISGLSSLSTDEIGRIAENIVREVRQRCDHRTASPNIDCTANNLSQLIASAYGLDGPCVVVDAACASSLQALALGARSLQQGEAEMVVVGGASYCKSDSLVLFSAAQSVSAGKSCPFDENASGLVTAEGYVVLVLKTLQRAIADGDRIRCLIRGIGMSADGRGKSLWAPRKEGQAIAMQRAYPEPLRPQDVQFMEAHATSTQVGDATELSALAEAFPERLEGGRKIPLGSVKANVGHTLETAGVAGLIKAALAMQQQTIPPVANLEHPNTTVDWDKLPFYLPTKPEAWKAPADGSPRRAAVNSFGIGGLNVHILLEEYRPETAKLASPDVPTASESLTHEPIAVVGVGAILPKANSIEEYWQLLESGQDAKCDAPPERLDASLWVDPSGRTEYRAAHARGGFITDYAYDWRRHRVPPKQVANANPLQFMLLDATEQALEQSGYLKKDFDRERVGVIVGTVFGGDFANQLQAGLRLPEFGKSLREKLTAKGLAAEEIERAITEYDEVLLKRFPALLDETGSFTSSTLASRITKTFDLKGGALAMDAGHGSGLAAINAGIQVLRSGECDMMICATGQRNMDLFTFESLARSGLLADLTGRHTFDANADGFVPGEGCGAVLLKRLSDAERDGDQILAVLHGVGCSTDWKEHGAAVRNAVQRALDVAGASPADVRFVETLGGPRDLTSAELQAIGTVLASGPRLEPVQVNALVSQFGYLGAAHGMAGILKGILAFSHERYPAGVVSTHPASDLPFGAEVQPQTSSVSVPADLDAVMGVSCGGVAGPAYFALVEPAARALARSRQKSAVQPAKASTMEAAQIVRLGANDWSTLSARLQSTPAAELYHPEYRFTVGDRARLAIVCRDPADFAAKCQEAVAKLGSRDALTRDRLAGRGIYFGEPHPFSAGTAFMFPGQGSQYPGMLGQLIEELPEARIACQRADAAMRALGYESFAQIAGPDVKDLGQDVWKTQISMLLADCILEDTLRQLGLTPSIVAGHSYGEYAALVCAGAWSLSDAIRGTRHRYQSIAETVAGTGCMAATNAPAEEVERILSKIAGDVYPANLNAPEQTVIGGRKPAVEHAIERLKQAGHTAVMIKVPCPFHTRLMAPTADVFIERLQEIPLRDTVTPVVSTASGRAMRSAAEIRQSLIDQLTKPVRYGEILAEVLNVQPALVVEVGPRQTLTQLNKKNHTADDVVFLSSDVVRRPGAATLLGVLAQADCLGCLELQARREQGGGKPAANRQGRLLVHDATERRTARMRAQAAASPATGKLPPSPTPAAGSPARAVSNSGTARSTPSAASVRPTPEAVAASPARGPAETPRGGLQPSTAEATRPAPKTSTSMVAVPDASSAPSRQELQAILVGFVVEQTGYPEDIIETDVDLEADLGIDSIKKAQLFGEVGERFQIAPREDMSLDDFPTLDHVLDFLVEELGQSSDRTREADSVTTWTESSSSASPVETLASRSTTGLLVASPVTESPVSESPVTESPVSESAVGPTRAELQEILVGFVVEQTGYPEDIIETDADLEADLGIDSIKKAQLFGEVGERFQIAPREDLSLDDFPTLDHVLDFLVAELGPAEASAEALESAVQPAAADPLRTEHAATEAPPSANTVPATLATTAGSGPSREELQEILVGFVVEQTGYPEDIIELDADLEADLGIDSIKKAQLFGEVGERFQIAPREDLSLDDFPTLDHVLDFLVVELQGPAVETVSVATTRVVPATPVEVTISEVATESAIAPVTRDGLEVAATSTSGPSEQELQEILVSFVVDQTGYPEDIIEMDADLEADLGIDSIKKAQLFGEVGERFQIAPREDLSLDDFPTLGHVLQFLHAELSGETSAEFSVEPAEAFAAADTAAAADSIVTSPTSATRPASGNGTATGYYAGNGKNSRESDLSRAEAVWFQVLEGSPEDLGRLHGNALKRAIHRELATVLDRRPKTNGTPTPRWPEPCWEELAALAEEAEVNRAAVSAWNQLAEPLAALRTSFGEQVTQPLAPDQRFAMTLVQVRKPGAGLSYLTFGRPGRLTVPAGINAADLAISCEPLDGESPASDVIHLTSWLHRELTASQSIDETAERLGQLLLKGRWSIGVSSPSKGQTRYWSSESGRVRVSGAAATPDQEAYHRMLEREPGAVVLADRRSGLSERFPLDTWLERTAAAVAKSAPCMAAPVRTAPVHAEPANTSPVASEPEIAKVMRRHVLRMTACDRPASDVRTYAAGTHVCVIGNADLTRAVAQHLEGIGCQVSTLDRDSLSTAFSPDAGALPQHLVVMTEADSPRLDDFAPAEHFDGLFHACRRWIEALEQSQSLADASLVAVTRMGGDFGFHSTQPAFSGGGITGLLKGVRREYPAARYKVLDFPADASMETVCSELVDELNTSAGDLEVGFRDGQRYVVQAVAAPATSDGMRDVTRGGVWVVSGGGRGVTFAVAREMARRYDLTLHLLGTATLPDHPIWRGKSEEELRELKRELAIQARREKANPGTAWRRVEKEMELDRNLKQLAQDGIHATYHACDIADRSALDAVLSTIRSQDGPIQGIVHGAGVEAACRFTRKKEASVRATIASKCDGASNLIALTREDPLEAFLGFGSTSGRFGGLGQADYSLASDLLAKMVGRLAAERPDCAAVCFHWPAWAEVGMAVRPESKMALERGGISFMPVLEGVEHVLAELRSAEPEREILILDKPDVLDTDGTMVRSAKACDPAVFRAPLKHPVAPPTAAAVRPDSQARASGSGQTIDCSRMPMIDSLRAITPSEMYEAGVVLDAGRDPFLLNHRFRGKPFLPGVIAMEMFAEAAALVRPESMFTGIRDLQLINGWSFEPEQTHEAKIVMRLVEQGVRCELRGPRTNSRGQIVETDRLYSTALVEMSDGPPEIETIDPGKPIMMWTPFFYPDNVAIHHGPPLRTFKQLDFLHGGGRAMLSSGVWQELLGDRSGDSAMVGAAVLDGCMVACGTFSFFMVNTRVEIPRGIGHFRQVRLPRPGEVCILRFFLREANGTGNRYDFTLVGDKGDVIFAVEGYQSVQPTEMT